FHTHYRSNLSDLLSVAIQAATNSTTGRSNFFYGCVVKDQKISGNSFALNSNVGNCFRFVANHGLTIFRVP
ncbi:MAG: hypothetical protein VYB72_02275, partial [Planctomycetota bacterium]|nr:hypothetical protein [Planctomycetota bacterium]